MIKKVFNLRNLNIFIFITLVLSIIYVVFRMTESPVVPVEDDGSIRVKSDYVLMLLQCVIGIVAMLLPSILKVRAHIVIPSSMLAAYVIFLYCAIYLGEVRAFYYTVPYWDTILHVFSSAMLGAVGFSVISLLNNAERISIHLTPLFVALFTFCFAVTLGVVWEFYEYAADCILNTNMQKFALESGEPLTGQAALADTMKDLIVDSIGALSISAIGYVSLKFETGWLEKIQIRIHKK